MELAAALLAPVEAVGETPVANPTGRLSAPAPAGVVVELAESGLLSPFEVGGVYGAVSDSELGASPFAVVCDADEAVEAGFDTPRLLAIPADPTAITLPHVENKFDGSWNRLKKLSRCDADIVCN